MSAINRTTSIPNFMMQSPIIDSTAELPRSPKAVKHMEKEIHKEAKYEDKNVKGAVKDLTRTRKAETKALKEAEKADKTLDKLRKKEHDALKALHKAQSSHDITVSKLHKAEQDFDLASKSHNRIQEALEMKSAHVQEVVKEQEEHTQARNSKLNALHTSPAENMAS